MILQTYLMIWIFPMMLTSVILGLSSSNYFNFWLFLELNLLSFTYLLSISWNSNKSNVSVKYFLVQSFFSVMVLFSFLSLDAGIFTEMSLLCLLFAFLGKLGMAPLHMWFILIIQEVSWDMLFWLISVQKVLPLFGVSNLWFKYVLPSIFLSVVISVVASFNQMLVKLLLGFSSIFNLAWMISISYNFFLTLFFLITYSLSVAPFIFLCKKVKLLNLKHFSMMLGTPYKGVLLLATILSMSGLPPFIGFFGKLLILQELVVSHKVFLAVLFFFFFLLILMFYLRMMYFLLSINIISFYCPIKSSESNVLLLIISSGYLMLLFL